MKRLVVSKWATIAVITMILTGCSVQPNQQEMQQIPTIQLDDIIPQNGEYILYLPAAKDIAMTASITGDIFQQEALQILTVKLKHDMYSYKKWLSFDKKKWWKAQDALNIRIDLKLPSYAHPHAGKIMLQLSEKNNLHK